MNLVADEGVDRVIVERLRRDGHNVTWIAEIAPSVLDEYVLAFAGREGDRLITADKDFGDLVFRQRLVAAGVILIRLPGSTPSAKAQIVSAVIRQHDEQLRDHFTVVTPGNVRSRRLAP